MLLAISFAIISETDSLKDAYLLICCLQIGNDKNEKKKHLKEKKEEKNITVDV